MDEQAAPVAPAHPRDGAVRRPRTSLGDDALADEIELYGAVVVAASEKDGSLSPAEIDEALGVPDDLEPGSSAPAG